MKKPFPDVLPPGLSDKLDYLRAFFLASHYQLTSPYSSQYTVVDVIEWMYPWSGFDDRSQDHEFSFPSVCRTLGFDPYVTQEVVLSQLKELSREHARWDDDLPAPFVWRVHQVVSPQRSIRPSRSDSQRSLFQDGLIQVSDATFSRSVQQLYKDLLVEANNDKPLDWFPPYPTDRQHQLLSERGNG